jgi:hypothetical protein
LRKKITLWRSSASRISSTVAASRSPASATPSMRAPMRLPSWVTVRVDVDGIVIAVALSADV